MSNIENIGDMLGKLYDRYIMRDFAHIFAGAFILVVVAYSLEKNEVFFTFISGDFVKLIIFLFSSYSLGMLSAEIPSFLFTRKKYRNAKFDLSMKFQKIMITIKEEYGIEPLRLIERFENLRRFGYSLVPASVIGFICFVSLKWKFWSYTHLDILIIIGIIFVLFSSLRLFIRMKDLVGKSKQHYIDELNKNQKPCKEKL